VAVADVMIARSGILFCLLKYAFLLGPICFYWQRIISISQLPPKGDFIDMLSRDCQVHL